MAQRINTLMAHKAINLAKELSNSEKQVVGALIDHYNHRTGQCDPSLDSLAELINVSRRTVIRAIARLQKSGFVHRVRHGGKFHRNQYEPIWSRFVQAEAEWKGKRSTWSARFGSPKASPCPSQSCHNAGDTADTQTSSNNLSNVTLPQQTSLAPVLPVRFLKENGSPKKDGYRDLPIDGPYLNRSAAASSATAARNSAERRWNTELQSRYVGTDLFGQIVDAVDMRLSVSVTDAELSRRGSGLTYLMNELLARDAAFKAQATVGNADQGGPQSPEP
jgi:predicted transcriptional regulator